MKYPLGVKGENNVKSESQKGSRRVDGSAHEADDTREGPRGYGSGHRAPEGRGREARCEGVTR